MNERQLTTAIGRVECGKILPFDHGLLLSFIELAASCLADDNTLLETVIIDRLALAAAKDIADDHGFNLG